MGLEKQKVEMIQDFLIEKWWSMLRNHPKEIFSLKNLSIYRTAARNDTHLRSRIIKKVLTKARMLKRPAEKQK